MARARDLLTKLRKLCLTLPETSERISHGEPASFVSVAPPPAGR